MAQIVVSNTLLVSANLAEALALVDQRMAGWASNSGAYNALLQQVFGRAGSDPALWQQAATTLQSTVKSPGLAISLEVLNNDQLPGINGAYTANALGRGERVYLNAAWLQTSSAAQIEAVLLEELGHAIDTRLNGKADSPGDEGERFSALLRGVQPSAHSSSENDQRQLVVDDSIINIEAADITPPVARSGSPTFAAGSNFSGVGDASSTSFVDIDGDGDLDAFIGNNYGSILFFLNTASAGSTIPAYAPAIFNPFGLINDGPRPELSFVDIDRDGDLDAFIGNFDGNTLFFRNTAASGVTTPTFAAATINPFGLAGVVGKASSAFADIDGDGDLDAFISNSSGYTLFLRNTAVAGSTNPAFAAPTNNPFGLVDVGFSGANPELVDIDSDGDLDLFIGQYNGNILLFRNTSPLGSTTPAFAAPSINPFGLTDVGFASSPNFVDVDGDGDLDAFISNENLITNFFQNTAPILGVSSTTSNGTYGPGAVITLTVRFSEIVVVTGAPRLQLETGSTDRFATFSGGSGTNTLSFSYTVQAGDTSADLDVLSAGALSLNGGTIRDAAGNNAVLTLAAPGSPASLAARKNLVIAGTTVSSVSSPAANGTYGPGASITITVTFSQAVLVTGIPRLTLETGNTDRFATYTAGSGTNTLTFSYTVQPGDNSADLDAISINALALNGGSIRDLAFGNNASLRLPAPGAAGSLGASKNLVIDGVAPVVRSSSPAFAAVIINPFGLVISEPIPSSEVVDIDGDGDLDVFIGNYSGNTIFFRNTAPAGSTTPAFAASVTNPFGLADVGSFGKPSFIDIDFDGDIDAFIGNRDGTILFFRNTATPGATNPAFAAAITNPFGLVDVGRFASPEFVDIDRDGDLDAFIGTDSGNTLFFRNTAAAGSTSPTFSTAITNPFGLTDMGQGVGFARPELADIDGDGDLDAIISNRLGITLFFRNTSPAGSSTPAFSAATLNPFGLVDVGFGASPTLADIDGDGDLDAFIGNYSGDINFFRNTAPSLSVSSTTANGTYGPGAVITLTVRFSENVVVTGAPRLQLETGATDRFATFSGGSGTNTLSFSYTVQVGDVSDDLDVIGPGALTLNGGTIRDASGNNAVLTLSAPGSPASLGTRKNLVIAGATRSAVSSVSSSTANGTYLAGALITISVTFSQAVLVTGIPRLALETGDTDRFATYTSGSGTNALTFSYTVQPGDNSADLDAISINALSLNGGTIRDVAFGNNASLRLPAPGAPGSLAATKNLVIDASRPVVLTTASAFAEISTNPFGLTDGGSNASPTLVDIDRDGDFDAFIGNRDGNILFFRNTAAPGASTPAFAGSASAFGLQNVGSYATPSFVDIDGDRDLDVYIGNRDGNILFFRNTAAPGATAPAFSGSANAFGLPDVGAYATPSFTDIDGDGDLDAFIGNRDGNILFFRNTAGPGASSPAYAGSANAFGLPDVGAYATPRFADIDGDGDLDAFIGNQDGTIFFFRNTAAPGASIPAFAGSASAFGLGVGAYAIPSFADIDGDGDLDAFIGNRDGNILFFRNTAPSLGVSSTTANGTYGPGAVITLTVRFSENVVVTSAPRLQLETGATDRFATFSGGSGTNTLSFSYTVQAGDTSADLDVVRSAALTLNGGTIRDAAGNNAVLTLAAPGSPASLGARKNLVIAGTTVSSVSSPTANGNYGPGALISITVLFSQAVLVTGIPRLALETGDTDRFATYTAGSGTNTLTFSYTVQPGDNAADLDTIGINALSLNGGTIRDVAFGNNASLTLPAPGAPGSLGVNKNLSIDVLAPVARSTTPAFSAATPNPFGIEQDGFLGNSSIVDIDADGDLDILISDTTGSISVLRNNALPGSSTPIFNREPFSPFNFRASGVRQNFSLVDIDRDGDSDVFIGTTEGNFSFFRNTAAPGSTAPAFAAGITNPFGLRNAGRVANPNFVDIDKDGDLDIFTIDGSNNILFIKNSGPLGSTTPAFAAATLNPFGLEGQFYDSIPTFVDIDNDGDLDAFVGDDEANTVFFRNTAVAGSLLPAFRRESTNPFGLQADNLGTPVLIDIDGDGDLDAFISPGSGRDIIFFRNTAPVLGVSSTTTNGTYGPGAVITLTVRFSENVVVTGAPRLQLETGSTDRFASYTAGSGTNTLTFSYTVQAGDSSADLDLLSVNALSLNGGTIRDAAGNNAVLTLAAPGSPASLAARKNLVIAGTTVSSVSSPTANGTYGPGASITITVTFSQAVLVTGIPRLTLETGNTDRFATYTAGSGTNTLTFSYTVQPGDSAADLDAIGINALALNGGSIRDVAFGNNASLRLPAPGTAGSLGANKNLVIDGVAPIARGSIPAFAAATPNPFGLTDVGIYANPSFVDIDGDGDLDAFIGERYGNTIFFRNTASLSATAPAFALATTNPFGLTDVGGVADLSLVDIDSDGDLDVFIGNSLGNTLFFRNTAIAGSTTPAFATPTTNPFGLTDVGSSASPTFVDIDRDGDLDLFIGNLDGNTLFFRNTAALGATVPNFGAAPTINPFGIIDVGSFSIPSFADTDGDGDLDLFIGNGSFDSGVGNTLFFHNTAPAGATAPAYAAPITNPFGLGFVDLVASPVFADFDRDSDLDLFIGDGSGNVQFFRNTAPVLGANSSTANGTYRPGAVITLTVRFSEAVVVNTTGGTPTLALETGTVDRVATFTGGSGTNTLTFSYTVQSGDTSPDLDLRAANAIALNGATIRDIAGNNAVLTLADPGSPASLAGRKNLVIDGIAPLITAGPTATTAPGISGFTLRANEAATGALRRADNSLLFPTALAANTSTLVTVAAQAAITATSVEVTDLAGNRTTAATRVLLGTNNADALNGSANADIIFGFGGNDTLAGAAGVDVLIGGDGNDTYTIDSIGDLVVETNANPITGGTDTVLSSLANYTLTDNVENLTLTGAASINGTGNTLNNLLNGNAAANSLNGGAGIDTLTGGDGSDTYIIETSGDLVIETNANAAISGTDRVVSSLANYTLTANVENLTLGSGGLNGTGNILNNLINGNNAANVLNGAAGADTLIGGDGNDAYVIDNAGDLVIETNTNLATGGTDRVVSSLANYTLTHNVEALTLGGGAINGTGNVLNNAINGNSAANSLNGASGNDTLIGGAGNDTLTGGLNADTFRFDSALNATTNRDLITDFSLAQSDRIELENSVFTTLTTTGTLAAAGFTTGASATTASHRILYNTTTGLLAFDSDGTGAATAIAFATLTQGLALTHASFTVT